MGNYSIYWIKEEFAYRYFHKSGILYRFLKEYQTNTERTDLKNQFNYITKSFPAASLLTHIKNHLQTRKNIMVNGKYIEMFTNDSHYITLHIQEKQINFRCEMLHDAEKLLFPALRSFHPCLFIVGNDLDNYGWISLVSMERAYLHGQVLYS
ncbi:sporulation inhibitor of replication protein SirA [Lentibacillus sp. Marseille-P4043]|uniref:sporulation inhibitor of replication protein SirA n=1 Tax=Lentibacillus sp. Marseille-P4043 TaxID=2040293 RepID=UPI00131A4986|nr:sporulation inhibitor of replication protein SirA [Lentibacillus sp. Marseille-P4043]